MDLSTALKLAAQALEYVLDNDTEYMDDDAVSDYTEAHRVINAPDEELAMLRAEIRTALEGDSNDAEHDALASCATALGIDLSRKWFD